MDVQVTVKIGSEGLKELAEMLRIAIMNADAENSKDDITSEVPTTPVQTVARQGIPITTGPTDQVGDPSTPAYQPATTGQTVYLPIQQPAAQEAVSAPVPTTAHEYNLGDLSQAAMQLMDKGMQTQLQQLLSGYGVAALPELPQEQYGNFATALRGMGAQI